MGGPGLGRGAHTIISLHYPGDAETARCAAEAEALLKHIHYKNKASFPFKHYITRLNECFELMDDNTIAVNIVPCDSTVFSHGISLR
jgi:hypothetical protein